jgi:hypothetical protein
MEIMRIIPIKQMIVHYSFVYHLKKGRKEQKKTRRQEKHL